MPSPLSYEPSVQAVLGDVLPPGTRVLAGELRLRNRIAWPLTLRSTGLGEIEGGELVLVPPGRAPELLSRARDLATSGIAALILSEEVDEDMLGPIDLPILTLPAAADLRQCQIEIERYLTRRRRELFALDQELHRTLVDGAIAGADLSELTALAARRAGRQVVVDGDGEVIRGRAHDPVPGEVLRRARELVHGRDSAPVLIPGDPAALAAPIVAGREQYGLSLVIGSPTELSDDHDVILVSLASAAAIILAREPQVALEPLGALLQALDGHRPTERHSWTAVALSSEEVEWRRLHRAAQAELRARGDRGYLAQEGDALVVLLNTDDRTLGAALIRSLRARTGSTGTRAGIGRPEPGVTGARRSTEQALAALHEAGPGQVLEYGAIEVEVLLRRDRGWLDFAAAQLGPLLEPRADERELLRTLRAYLACGRNAKAAARDLQVHRNTLQYRLRRIAAILGRSLDDTDTLFALDLACRIVAAGYESLR